MGRHRFGWLQIVLGVALVASAAALGGVAWLLAWPALALFVVGAGYVHFGPVVFGKRADGSFEPVALALLLPYHAVAHALLRAKLVLHDEAAWDEIDRGLYLGRFVSGRELPPDVAVVVDLTAELPRVAPLPEGVRYRLVPTLDATAPTFEPFAALARELASEPRPIFVHCAMGHGRSATFAAALLVARARARDALEAEALLRATRPGVRLHDEQRALVARFASTLGRGGVDVAESRG